MPRSGPGSEINLPRTRAVPDVAVSKPAMMRSRVDLPQPDAPIRQMNSPWLIDRFTSRSAWMRAPLSSNSFDRCSISSRRNVARSPVMRIASSVLRAPAQEAAVEPGDRLVGQEAGDADDDHAPNAKAGPPQGTPPHP